jgi:hypothetical protein
VHSYSLRIEPRGGDHFLNWIRDPHGNFVARVVVPKPTLDFKVNVELVAELELSIRSTSFSSPGGRFPFRVSLRAEKRARAYLITVPLTPKVKDFIAGCTVGSEGERSVDFLVNTTAACSTSFAT